VTLRLPAECLRLIVTPTSMKDPRTLLPRNRAADFNWKYRDVTYLFPSIVSFFSEDNLLGTVGADIPYAQGQS
jgi:hypothetical protein